MIHLRLNISYNVTLSTHGDKCSGEIIKEIFYKKFLIGQIYCGNKVV